MALGVLGVVLGAVAAAWLEAALLARKVRGALAAGSGPTPGGGLGLEHVRAVRVLLAGALPAVAALGARYAVHPFLGDGPLAAAAVLGVFGAVFLVAAQLLGLGGVRSFLRR